ncbi:MAG TPA: hypothetical protein VF553_15400 [Pyrinomonadaceae bacterium]
MKKIVNRFVVLLVVCSLSSIMALAAGKSKKVTFLTDVTLNGTVIKKGTYQVTFDEKTGELTIADRKNVVAKGNARLEKFTGIRGTSYVTESNKELVSIVFNDNQASLGGGGGSTSAAP